MSTPAAMMAVARTTVVVIPPRAMPVRMLIIGAGDMMYSSRLPLSRSQYRWAPMPHRTFSQNVVMAAPRTT